MRITKFGHACLLIEEADLRLLTDPGSYSTQQDEVEDLDLVIVTHEHGDHLDLASLKRVLAKNPRVIVLANPDVCLLLKKEGIFAEVFRDGSELEVKGVKVEGVGTHHAVLYPSIPQILNTGYIIAGKLFYPGDAFTSAPYPVEVLALPVAAPWMRLAEAIDFAREQRPKVCFPVHDGILKAPGLSHSLPPRILEPEGIQWVLPELGISFDV